MPDKQTSLLRALNSIMNSLLEKTQASRTTVRLDIQSVGFQVNLPAAEAKRPDIKSLLNEGSLDQRAASTTQWLETERRILVQQEFETASAAPPKELVEIYDTHAQMLGPLFHDGHLFGWISVHSSSAPRRWTSRDIAALEWAIDGVMTVVEDNLEA